MSAITLSTTGLRLTANSALDLHLHTIYSDGHWEPAALLDYVRREQFALVAITDHDRTDTIAPLQHLARDKSMPVLVGVEMTTTWRGELTDLLCFGFDPHAKALSDLAQDLLCRQRENTRQVYETLQQHGYPLSPDALPALLAKPSAAQPHAIVAYLEDQGYDLGAPAMREALRASEITLATNEPAAVVEAAHQSGGVCLLAHPGHADGFVTYNTDLLDQFRQEAPIDGLEVYHPVHTPVQAEMYRAYARRHHLLVSAGSDSHRPDKPPLPYQAELCRNLLERVGIQVF